MMSVSNEVIDQVPRTAVATIQLTTVSTFDKLRETSHKFVTGVELR